MVDRLRLTKERIEGIADVCMELVDLEDPVGEVLQGSVRPNGNTSPQKYVYEWE